MMRDRRAPAYRKGHRRSLYVRGKNRARQLKTEISNVLLFLGISNFQREDLGSPRKAVDRHTIVYIHIGQVERAVDAGGRHTECVCDGSNREGLVNIEDLVESCEDHIARNIEAVPGDIAVVG